MTFGLGPPEPERRVRPAQRASLPTLNCGSIGIVHTIVKLAIFLPTGRFLLTGKVDLGQLHAELDVD